jgi:hypothetical protein
VAGWGSVFSGGCNEPVDGRCTPPEAVDIPAPEGWAHKNDPAEHVYGANPPASGPHYPVWAAWGVHDEVVERGLWVHNVEHGGIVFLVGETATATAEDELRAAFEALPDDPSCGHRRALLTRDPLLDDPVAVVAAHVVLVPGPLDSGVLQRDRIIAFATACRNHAPEDVCP